MEKEDLLKKTVILIVAKRKDSAWPLEALQDIPDLKMEWAESVKEALVRLPDHPFSLILFDVKLLQGKADETAMLGGEFLGSKSIPIVLIGDVESIRTDLSMGNVYGTVDYVLDPVEPFILKNKIILLLELQRTKLQLEEKSKELEEKTLELEVLYNELEEKSERLEMLSSLDGLTGLFNRRYFDDNLLKEWKQAVRDKSPLSVVIVDIDCFKDYNDHYGHLLGDSCLCKVALALYETLLRPVDIIARYGGEEFAVILPNTGRSGAEMVARRMKEGIADLDIPHETSSVASNLTVSIGGSTIVPSSKLTVSLLLDRTEKALNMAKTSGRNCYRFTGE